jgi:hypothetical protein
VSLALKAPAAAQGDRAINEAINAAAYNDRDLTQGVENGTVKLDTLKKGELPDELQKLSPDERRKVIGDKIEERKKIRYQILELSKKRDAFILEERKKQSTKKPTGFDEAVNAALKAQIARKGLKLRALGTSAKDEPSPGPDRKQSIGRGMISSAWVPGSRHVPG